MTTKSGELDVVLSERSQFDEADEAEWRAWLAKNRAEEVRGAERRMRIITAACMGLLLGMALLWTALAPYQRGIIFAVALGAVILMLSALHAHRYVLAVAFAALVLLYNPLFPNFDLSGGWQRIIVLASIGPFLASLLRRKPLTSVPVRVQVAN